MFQRILSLIGVCVFSLMLNMVPGDRLVYAAADESIAADFSLKDLKGNLVRLEDYKGSPILLDFMTTRCSACRDSIPHLKQIHARYSGKGLVILAIAVQETQPRAAAFSKKYDLPFPVLLDSEAKVAQRYGVMGVPVTALINREGRIICWNCRSLDDLLEKEFSKK
jgi:peroxiredoxin